MASPQQTSYDEVPYESFSVHGTHPDRLWTLAKLAGIEAVAPRTCKVLELGCAGGGNLIPMALELPHAQFVGVDLSAVQIAAGDALTRALQLSNVKLIAASVMDVDESYGTFDYIIAHGIYSWVPNDVQEKVLEICKRNLTPCGVAYVSYNTLPGWRMRGMIRDLMRYQALQFSDPREQVSQARGMLDFLAKGTDENSAYGKLLRSELELLRGLPDFYILHEHLEELNEPLYFHEFVQRAAHHGLQYLADANVTTTVTSRFPPQVADTLRRIANDVIRQEQMIDFLSNRTFRQTLLVHAEQSVDRNMSSQCLRELWVSSIARPSNAQPNLTEGVLEKFCTPTETCITTPKAITKSALVTLASRSPSAISLDDLLGSAYSRLNPMSAKAPGAAEFETLAADLLPGFVAGLVDFHSGPSPFSIEPSERPQASALARYQAERGPRITTLRHESIVVPEMIRALIPMLDGRRSIEELAAAVKKSGSAVMSRFTDPATLRTAVRDIAQHALIARSE